MMIETDLTPAGGGDASVPATTSFGARLARARAEQGVVCVGIDPHATELAAWGLPDDAAGVRSFALGLLEAVAGRVTAVKPQSAFFERHGSAGVAVLEELLAAARELDVLVVLDVKRGDIGSTAAGYAQAYLDPASTLAADAITASPFLGVGALEPMFAAAAEHGTGVFVLAMTSNPEGRSVQQAITSTGATVAGSVLAEVAARNAAAGTGAGSIGAVVGATVGDTGGVGEQDFRIGGPLLAPGVGVQGATAADLPTVFGAALPDVLPSMSRSISGQGPDPAAIRRAVDAQNTAFRTVLDAWDHVAAPDAPR